VKTQTKITIPAGDDDDPDAFETDYDVVADWEFSPYDPGFTAGPIESCYPPEGGEVLSCVITREDDEVIPYGVEWLERAIGQRATSDEIERALLRAIEEGER